MPVVLNPHGSDETFENILYYSKLPMFLTHTVQMKQFIPLEEAFEQCEVLNPHGSDETKEEVS